MGAFWKLEESRLIQTRSVVSAANSDNVSLAAFPVPAGKIWQILAVGYYPSVTETQVVSFLKADSGSRIYSILNPVSMNLNPAGAYGTFIEQGMEYTLYPGEYIGCYRATHTAGSTMTLVMQFVH